MLSIAVLSLAVLAPTFEAPIDLPRGIPIVTLEANKGQKLRWIVDTGAGRSVVDSKKAADLGLKASGSVGATGTGGTVQASVYEGLVIRVGDERIALPSIGVPLDGVASMLGSRFDGILGHEFFRGRIVEIDYGARRLRIYSPTAFAAPDGAIRATFRVVGGRPHADVVLRIGDDKELATTLVLDTGANTAVSLTKAFTTEQSLALQESAGRVGGVGGARKTYRTPVRQVRLGETWLPVGTASVSDKSLSAAAGMLGSGAFRGRRLFLDYDRGQLWLTPVGK